MINASWFSSMFRPRINYYNFGGSDVVLKANFTSVTDTKLNVEAIFGMQTPP